MTCREVQDALEVLKINDVGYYTQLDKDNCRESCRKKITCLQRERIWRKMVECSKGANLLNDFNFDGTVREYIYRLPFTEARVLFMLRARMFPSKCNFKERWSVDSECVFCKIKENDLHFFSCPAYLDLTANWEYWSVVLLKLDLEHLYSAAKMMLKVKERVELFNA